MIIWGPLLPVPCQLVLSIEVFSPGRTTRQDKIGEIKRLMEKTKLSVCIITYNEENNLGGCIESFVGLSDEIIIMDSMSTDRTERIANRYNARFAVHPFDDFGKQKQRAIDLATHSWILLIDADERLSEELYRELTDLLKDRNRLELKDAYRVNRLNFFMGKPIRHGGWSPDYLVRLFRKGSAHLSNNLVHESVLPAGKIGSLDHLLFHYTYLTLDSFIEKNARYAKLSAQEKKLRGTKPGFFKVIFDPPFVFVKMFFLQQGFRDGKEGFFLAILYGYYTALKYIWLFYL